MPNLDISFPVSASGAGIWSQFTARDGLPDLKIESAFQDRCGVLWIGTHDQGVVYFEGDEFIPLSFGSGFAGCGVYSIEEDRQGNLWFGTDQGLMRYDGQVVRRFDLSVCFLWGSCVDQEGTLWFGAGRRPGQPPVVCRCSGDEPKIVAVDDQATREGQSIHCMAVDRDGHVWCGGDGLYRYDGRRFERIAVAGSPGQFTAVLPRSDGTIWMVDDQGRLFEHGAGGIRPLPENIAVKSVDENVSIEGLREDRSGRVWVVTYDGRVLCHERETFYPVCRLSAVIWKAFCLDRMGRLWIGSFGDGLFCYDAARFRLFPEARGRSVSTVHCLTEDAGGTVWAGTKKGLFGYRDRELHIAEKLGEREITGLLFDSRARLWVGTMEGRLYMRDQDGLHELFGHSTRDAVFSMAEDAHGRIWFGSRFGTGIGYYADGQVCLFPESGREEYPSWVGALAADREGNVWIGSASPADWDGLCRWNGRGFERVDAVSGVSIYALCADGQGHLWIGTNQGLLHYDGTDCTVFAGQKKLPFNIVTALLEDRDGTLWIGTEGGGLCRYDGRVFQTVKIPSDPRLSVIHAIHQDRGGRIWLATEAGLMKYTSHKGLPEVIVEEVEADEVYLQPEQVSCPSHTPCIAFHLKGCSHDLPSRLVYSYRLEGYDAGWQQTRESVVDYPQLRPGLYTFTVQAVDPDLNYSSPSRVALRVRRKRRRGRRTRQLTEYPVPLIGKSKVWQRVCAELAGEVIRSKVSILLLGETGTGKGLVAQAIHGLSTRHDKPFKQVNCGAIPRGLIESVLFGHEKGAFTGADARRAGFFEQAGGGTLFLDEIGDLSPEVQAVLLQVLQEGTYQRVGGEEVLQADVRIIAATHRDLWKEVQEERFRADLYYRVHAYPIPLPPLRSRKEDIPLLVDHFIRKTAIRMELKPPDVCAQALESLMSHDWPGNVRELEHTVQRAVLLSEGREIQPADVELRPVCFAEIRGAEPDFLPLQEVERRYLSRVLKHTRGKIYGPGGAAEIVDMHPDTLRSRLEKLGMKKRKKKG